MKIFSAMVVTIAIFGMVLGLASATSYSIGKTSLSGNVLDWDGRKITAEGNARFVTTDVGARVSPGTMRLESMTAQTITIQLATGPRGQQTLREASASGNVVIRAKRADVTTDDDGKQVTKIRDVHASARSAVIPQSQDVVRLTGNVSIKVTEPGASEPIAVLTGEVVTVSLSDNKIRIEGQSGKPAEITVSPQSEE